MSLRCPLYSSYTASYGSLYMGKVGSSVSVTVTKRMLVSGTHSSFTAPNWWQPTYGNYVLGHIWASTLGGPGGDTYENMTPLFEKANLAMRSCEIFAKALVEECCYCLQYNVTVNDYGQNQRSGMPPKALVPSSVTINITAFMSNGPNKTYQFTIPNTPNANTDPPACKNANLPCRQ